jgi:hypothetical protein
MRGTVSTAPVVQLDRPHKTRRIPRCDAIHLDLSGSLSLDMRKPASAVSRRRRQRRAEMTTNVRAFVRLHRLQAQRPGDVEVVTRAERRGGRERQGKEGWGHSMRHDR